MTDNVSDLLADLKAWVSRLEGTKTVQTVVTDVDAGLAKAWAFIQQQGLQDAYNIVLTAVTALATGTAPEAAGAAAVTALEAAGKSLEQGTVNLLVSQAQADLAASSLANPTA